MSNKLLHQIILNFAVKKTETIFRQETNLKLRPLMYPDCKIVLNKLWRKTKQKSSGVWAV